MATDPTGAERRRRSREMEMRAVKIIDMPKVGATPGGQDVHFTFTFDDGKEATFVCEHEKLGQLIVGLIRANQLAVDERHKHAGKAGQHSMSYAYDITELDVGVSDDPTNLTFRMQTKLGFSLDFRVPLDTAQKLSDGLPSLLDNVRSGVTKRPPKH